jgi:phage shock protein C
MFGARTPEPERYVPFLFPRASSMSKSLTRSSDQVIAGVCAGIADYLGWPVTRVRVAYVVLSILSAAFPGILIYLLLWLIMPLPGESGGF